MKKKKQQEKRIYGEEGEADLENNLLFCFGVNKKPEARGEGVAKEGRRDRQESRKEEKRKGEKRGERQERRRKRGEERGERKKNGK